MRPIRSILPLRSLEDKVPIIKFNLNLPRFFSRISTSRGFFVGSVVIAGNEIIIKLIVRSLILVSIPSLF